ncbi:gem-associated protein 6-like [Bolinopsis microptera]|uniref:gem-associated protein 6-like n=1 Tax=Bolinopsis microptera TaxID=2820187 RepID=UPI0030799987
MSVNDSQELLNLLGKEVEVSLVNQTTVTGRVYTVDPETRNFILMDETSTTFIPFSNINKYTLLSGHMNTVQLSELKQLDEKHFPSTISTISKENCEKMKVRLIEHLEKHRVPIELRGESEVVVAGVVSCRPPYDRNSCYSTNDIVLGRIQNILSTFEVS